jgi:hypothetical protein
MEDGASGHAVLVAAVNTLVQVPNLLGLAFRVKLHNALRFAARTLKAFRPPNALKVSDALFFVGKLANYFENGGLHLHGDLA